MRASFRCRTESGEPVGFTRLPMGCKCGPGVLNTITRVLAGDPLLALPMQASLKKLKVHVWIYDIRISSLREKVEVWGTKSRITCKAVGPLLGSNTFKQRNMFS
ncbi:uncharacterized protein TM35_000931050 [Trypanosoma theileri]|uniref:Uncharacterized protein n=1 Tax=Trypanosoma theileri TaxID=67003 RepID=A0A1X0NEI1_9TRYP|nr:uncharacterized protein TM35_000931050 [Trypanosoma theileri]ORC82347.1 hypothetical protein TM35_000931050 [Trypanosoma theileri]